MKLYLSSFLFIGIIFLLANCNESNQSPKMGILHPNNDSELTVLMREMYDYYDSLKVDINNGQVPKSFRDFSEIHSAVSTEPSKAESPLFKAMSKVYIESAQNLKVSNKDLPQTFNHMIDNCMNCHKQMCPGPMVKIKKLYLPVSN